MSTQITTTLICLFQIWTYAQDTSKMIEIEFLGTYQTDRAPCEWLLDGSRRWAMTTGFTVSTVIIGDLQVNYIEITPERPENNEVQLQEGELYNVRISMSKERFSALELGNEHTIMLYQDPILYDEITSIEKKIE